jgi:hypothetical protein
MIESRLTGRGRMQAALGLASLGLILLLHWQAALAIFTKPDELVLVALAPLLVASFRHAVLGRILAWTGVLLQIATMLVRP